MEETLEQAQSRHRKEQRDLQSRITQKKKNATKKTRKGVNDECAELERQLKERQEEELRRLTDPDGHDADAQDGEDSGQPDAEPEHRPDPSANDELSSKLESTTLSEPPRGQQPTPSHAAVEGTNGSGGGKKRNRQKERLARRAAEVEAAAAAAAEEASSMTDHRGTEKARMEPVFAANGLVEKEVAPDGHCLFAAFADGLRANGIEPSSKALVRTEEKAKVLPYRVVRTVAAGYMADHGDEFAGFLEEPLEEYVAKIRDTAEWGGQLELTALANAYGVEVRVVQDGRTEVIAPTEAVDGEKKVVWLAYYRHGYGLGEHYNSLMRKENNTA
ncbi:cysteine proteinase [Coniochaeta sp. PMI_546]|nr:cysteine proteinase [Coniochaeta sp. PMI_546]